MRTRVWANCNGVEVNQESTAGTHFASWSPLPYRIKEALAPELIFEGEAPPNKDTVLALRSLGARGAAILEEEGRKILAQGRYPWWFLDAAAPPTPPQPPCPACEKPQAECRGAFRGCVRHRASREPGAMRRYERGDLDGAPGTRLEWAQDLTRAPIVVLMDDNSEPV